ncbi:hypothetical protein [Paracoccus aestuariivivens]|uniref:Uncharacterized protein n=1 Tax=Paracoccus aestuariivivens TaxID=1820333 RepID=A0A6L6J853_9RHOB|nr:hypothetical protein [Paracoccus aestuariivivens]MTH76334.1 hypothetical protein [Paracoccus aestuariivivens]
MQTHSLPTASLAFIGAWRVVTDPEFAATLPASTRRMALNVVANQRRLGLLRGLNLPSARP